MSLNHKNDASLWHSKIYMKDSERSVTSNLLAVVEKQHCKMHELPFVVSYRKPWRATDNLLSMIHQVGPLFH